jgi:hypothetical protein
VEVPDPSLVETVGSRLAAPFLTLLPVAGVAISVFDQQQRGSLIHASDSIAGRLEEIQFDVGEGPSFDAFRTTETISVADLSLEDRWPAFLSYADDVPAAGAVVFPLALGAACIGAILCYRSTLGLLSAESLDVGAALGRAVAGPAFRHAIVLADDESPDTLAPIELRREVHQATGWVSGQLDVSLTDAFALMRAHAFTTSSSLSDVAHAVVARRLDFSKLP